MVTQGRQVQDIEGKKKEIKVEKIIRRVGWLLFLIFANTLSLFFFLYILSSFSVIFLPLKCIVIILHTYVHELPERVFSFSPPVQ